MASEYTFSYIDENITDNIFAALNAFNPNKKPPVFICIGSDLVLGDSLGPLVGTLLKKNSLGAYVYGTLNSPITAKEVDYARIYLKQMHPDCVTVAIDASIGVIDDIGAIKVRDCGIKPGLGVNKDLSEIGDKSIIGIVAEKTHDNYSLFNLTRLNLIYSLADKIACGIEKYLNYLSSGINEYYQSKYGAI